MKQQQQCRGTTMPAYGALPGSAVILGAVLEVLVPTSLSSQVRNDSLHLRPCHKPKKGRPDRGDPSHLTSAWLQNSHFDFLCLCWESADPRAGQVVFSATKSALAGHEKRCLHNRESWKTLTRASCGSRALLSIWDQPGFAAVNAGRSSGM